MNITECIPTVSGFPGSCVLHVVDELFADSRPSRHALEIPTLEAR
jgi:hypothetical protein